MRACGEPYIPLDAGGRLGGQVRGPRTAASVRGDPRRGVPPWRPGPGPRTLPAEMNSNLVAPLVFVVIVAATLVGMRVRMALPDHHLGDDTKDAVRIGMGLVATMSALILGLLVASAKGSYDTEKSEVTQMAAKIRLLDRVLVNCGPQAQDARRLLRAATEAAVTRIWSEGRASAGPADPSTAWSEDLPRAVQDLKTTDDAQVAFKAQAGSLVNDLGQMRWLLFEQSGSSLSQPLLIVVIVWLAIIFGSVGVFAPWNTTVLVSLSLAALSVSGAIFLILELDQPFGGLIQISNRHMLDALAHLGK